MSNTTQIRSVAILLPDMIGTTICAMPAVEAIRAALPDARLTLLGFPRVTELLRDEAAAAGGLRLLDLARLHDDLSLAFTEDGIPDMAFDFLSTPESEAALAKAGVPRRVGWPNEGLDTPGPTLAVPYPGERCQQSVQDYLDFATVAGLDAPFSPPRLIASEATRGAARRWFDAQNARDDRLFVLGIGGGNDRKRWPLSRYLELATWIESRGGGRPLFFSGPREVEIAARLRRELPSALVAESLPLDLAKGLVAECHLAVCNDHAIMHLAAALGVPTVGLFLASDPSEWFPYAPPSSYVMGPPLDCRPCYTEDCQHWTCNDPSLMAQVKARCDVLLATPAS